MEPSSTSSKRARPPTGGNHIPSCLVDGCTADLSKCRDYHRRHKVCEVHSKTAKVTIKGQEQRFCQQCSRFHSLAEFDEVKRSCRKRLDGHNRRRRKPQPESLSINSRRFLSNHQGARYIAFSNPQTYSTSAVCSSWMDAVKVETNMNSELIFSSSSSSSRRDSYKAEKQFSFIQTASSSLPGVSVCGNDGGSQKMFLNGLNQATDSNHAHSLLSSRPAESREIGSSPMLQSGQASSLSPHLQYNGLAMESKQVGGSLMPSDGNSNTNFHGHEMLRTGHPGSSASGTHQTLSFTWE